MTLKNRTNSRSVATSDWTCGRRRALAAIGAILAGTAHLSTTGSASQDAIEYTLRVEDGDGEEVGRTTVSDATDVSEYGEHVSFRSLGQSAGDGDHGYVDHFRFESGGVIEDWEDRGVDDYSLSRDPRGDAASFDVVSEPVSSGSAALEMHTTSGATMYTSREGLLELAEGHTIEGDIRHETDEAGAYGMKTGFRVGDDAAGSGGIHVQMINPGSQRSSAGVELRTPNGEGMVRFEPELQEYYTVAVDVGQGEPPDADGDGVSETQSDGSGNILEEENGSDSSGTPGFGLAAGIGALSIGAIGAAARRRFREE